MLPTLYEGNEGYYEMTPKTVPLWAHTLLHHGERSKVVLLAIGRRL